MPKFDFWRQEDWKFERPVNCTKPGDTSAHAPATMILLMAFSAICHWLVVWVVS